MLLHNIQNFLPLHPLLQRQQNMLIRPDQKSTAIVQSSTRDPSPPFLTINNIKVNTQRTDIKPQPCFTVPFPQRGNGFSPLREICAVDDQGECAHRAEIQCGVFANGNVGR
jgi:hypothetical protein